MSSQYNLAQRKQREDKVKDMLFTLVARENHKTKEVEHLPYSLKHIADINSTTVPKVIQIAKDIREQLEAEKELNNGY